MAYWGFNIKDIDRSVRPQDDFYRYANGGWLKRNTIPPAEARWGSFNILRYNTDAQLRTVIKEVLKRKKSKKGSPEQLVRDLYISTTDTKRHNALGIGPLAPLRLLVRDVTNKEELLRALARLHVLGISGGWGAFVDQDSKNSSRYILHLWQGGLGLPDRDYYLLDKPEQKRIRSAYIEHMRRMLALAGEKKNDMAAIEASVMKIETALARASMKKEDTRDPHKIYNKLSMRRLQSLSPAVGWADYFKRTHVKGSREIIVGQPEFFKALSGLLKKEPLEDWKRYLEWHIINDCSGMLSEKFVREGFKFSQALTGQKKLKPLWRRALGAVNTVGEALGKIYVKRYFPAEYKRVMDELVSNLFEVYEERIGALEWMSPSTKKKAKEKLNQMSRKIGYPRKWKIYKGLDIDPTDYFGNILRAEEWHHKKNMGKLQKPVDRGEWFMFPHTVNAYFSPNLNDIVFPAGILQRPFFDPRADAALNYGCIGAVIGHEMTHGFDDQGAKFDGKGNMRNWWTPADMKRFEERGRVLKEQYDGYTVAGGLKVNGQLTLGENIADLGGVTIAWDAYQKHLKRHGRKNIDGFSPEERFFLGFAMFERQLSRPEIQKMQVLTDPHAPDFTRINGPLANFEPFYKVFNMRKGDNLYREPKKRVVIW